MKSLKLITIGIFLLLAVTIQAQVAVKPNITQTPLWGPEGSTGMQYYYLPDIEVYYDINTSEFIYHQRNGWVKNANLPVQYKNYNLFKGYKVIMKYHGYKPYYNFSEYKIKYPKGYQGEQSKVSINTGTPPLWGPAGNSDARYYYLTDLYTYYDIHTSMFIFYEEGKWVYRDHLPTIYQNYDLYSAPKVAITDYCGEYPYINFAENSTKYAAGYHGISQKTIVEKQEKENTNDKIALITDKKMN